MGATYMLGDVREVLATLPDNSVDLVLTSPPFLALRSYLPAGHPDKGLEMGSEPNPGEFIDALLDVVEECRRVLAPHGSICFELGDTYSSAGGVTDNRETSAGGNDFAPRPKRGGGEQAKFRAGTPRWDGRPAGQVRTTTSDPVSYPARSTDGWPDAKSLTLIPELFRISLAYGRNPLTGRTTPRWRVRNVVRWCRPNPPVGALGDKFRPATSDMVVACVSGKRYFDLDAVRYKPTTTRARPNGAGIRGITEGGVVKEATISHPAGAPPLDWWKISTQPYEGSHYATWPEQLCVTPIKAMTPLRVCTTCGKPSERITGAYTLNAYRCSERPQTIRAVALADAAGLTDEHIAAVRAFGTSDAGKAMVINDGAGKASDAVKKLAGEAKAVLGGYFREFVMGTNAAPDHEWTDCKHDTWRNGVVLDPFAGSGTTLAVATGHGRDALGIDLDERNAELATQRIGPLLCTVIPRAEPNPGIVVSEGA